ncbi:hypothetical protein [Saccharopolyspora pogona]|uniref:hypothetical protein n=1 Tax=Saccharopolyspora pogona TaxID=333966 RepID=UPI0016843929|nr:hypothetical protein [Saccharopolyspora pogona]
MPGLTTTGWGQALAAEFGVEVLAPEGTLTIVPERSSFAGCWQLFRPGGAAVWSRYPMPPWEASLARFPDAVSVPAGLLVGASDTDHAAPQAVPVAQQHHRILLGADADPAQVAALLGSFPPSCELVPIAPATRTAESLRKVAVTAGEDVLATAAPLLHRPGTGTSVVVTDEQGHPAWPAFAAVLRHAPTGQIHVVRAGPPPEGWTHCGPLQYRGRDDNVVAQVVPAGGATPPPLTCATSGPQHRSFPVSRYQQGPAEPGT